MKPRNQIARFLRLTDPGNPDNTIGTYYVSKAADENALILFLDSTPDRNLGGGNWMRMSTWTNAEAPDIREHRIRQRHWSAFLLYQKSEAVRGFHKLTQ